MEKVSMAVKNLTKSFKGVEALKNASLAFMQGEVHALLGENGAGKSTLCKMLSGALTPDSGSIIVDGYEYPALTPFSSKAIGIGMIYQEFNLVPDMTVYENLFLGKEVRKGLNIDKNEMIRRTSEIFDRLNIRIDPSAKIKNLSVAYCQLVEISRAILENARYLIMDEPTAPLTIKEVDTLFDLVRELKTQGVTIIYISHRIEELLELSDRVTIMRDGEVITTLDTGTTNRSELIRLMVGRETNKEFPERCGGGLENEVLLEVGHLATDKIKDISFKLHRGEILGLAGLVGAGRTEVMRAIFGADKIKSGEIFIKGKKVSIKSPGKAIKAGIAMIPEDRKRQGIHLGLSIGHNISLAKLKDISVFATVSAKKERSLIERYKNVLSIKMSSPSDAASSLSGGNQQKIVVSKWMAIQSDILFFDEPTRGIDVGTKKEIYDLMDRLRREGKGIIMVSSEMLEVIGMCDRIIVMHEGVVEGELDASEMSQERILQLASGGDTTEKAG